MKQILKRLLWKVSLVQMTIPFSYSHCEFSFLFSFSFRLAPFCRDLIKPP